MEALEISNSQPKTPTTPTRSLPPNRTFNSMGVSETPKHDHFHQFSRFPFEIKEMIWLAAAAQCKGRIIRVTTHTTTESITEQREKSTSRQRIYLKAKVCPHNVPSLLHTNREAREIVTVTSKRYLLCFEELHGKPVYIDFSKDCIFLEDNYAVRAFYDYELWVENGRFLLPDYREALPRTLTILERNVQAIGIGEELSKSWFFILPRFRRLRYVYFQKTMCCQGLVPTNRTAPGRYRCLGTYRDTTSTRYNPQLQFQFAAEKRGSGSVRVPEIVELWPEVFSKLFAGEVF
jgi:hypothetical protein